MSWASKEAELEYERKRRADPERQAYNAAYWRQYRQKNLEQLREKNRAYYRANKDVANAKQRVIALRNFYKLTPEAYEKLLASQGGVCAICGTDDPGTKKGGWIVDHDHACCPGKKSCGRCVRGLLCDTCNKGIGYLRDDVDRVRAAVAYLSRDFNA